MPSRRPPETRVAPAATPAAPRTDLVLARRIQQGRQAIGLTQQALADALGLTESHVSRWETAEGSPGWEMLQPLAAQLRLSLAAFVAPPSEAEVAAANAAAQGRRRGRPRRVARAPGEGESAGPNADDTVTVACDGRSASGRDAEPQTGALDVRTVAGRVAARLTAALDTAYNASECAGPHLRRTMASILRKSGDPRQAGIARDLDRYSHVLEALRLWLAQHQPLPIPAARALAKLKLEEQTSTLVAPEDLLTAVRRWAGAPESEMPLRAAAPYFRVVAGLDAMVALACIDQLEYAAARAATASRPDVTKFPSDEGDRYAALIRRLRGDMPVEEAQEVD